MSEQQTHDAKTSAKGGAGSSAQTPDKPNEITRKSGQVSGPDVQQKRDAHSNSAKAGGGDESEDIRGGK